MIINNKLIIKATYIADYVAISQLQLYVIPLERRRIAWTVHAGTYILLRSDYIQSQEKCMQSRPVKQGDTIFNSLTITYPALQKC